MAVSKPTTDDLVGWLKLLTPVQAETMAVFDEAMAASVDDIESRIDLPAGTTDTNYPQRVRTAILINAARLVKRPSSPEGVAGFGELGVVRITQTDPDVESLIRRFLKVDGFA